MHKSVDGVVVIRTRAGPKDVKARRIHSALGRRQNKTFLQLVVMQKIVPKMVPRGQRDQIGRLLLLCTDCGYIL